MGSWLEIRFFQLTARNQKPLRHLGGRSGWKGSLSCRAEGQLVGTWIRSTRMPNCSVAHRRRWSCRTPPHAHTSLPPQTPGRGAGRAGHHQAPGRRPCRHEAVRGTQVGAACPERPLRRRRPESRSRRPIEFGRRACEANSFLDSSSFFLLLLPSPNSSAHVSIVPRLRRPHGSHIVFVFVLLLSSSSFSSLPSCFFLYACSVFVCLVVSLFNGSFIECFSGL